MTAGTWGDTNEGEDEADDAVLALLVHVQNNSSRKGDPRESGAAAGLSLVGFRSPWQ